MREVEAEMSIAKNAPYYDFAVWLNEMLIEYMNKQHIWLKSTRQVSTMLGSSNSTVGAWLKGVTRPQRAQCVTIAAKLNLDVSVVLYKAGYRTLSDTTGATLPELITYIINLHQLSDDQRIGLVVALKKAQTFEDGWSDIINDILRKNWSLVQRAEYIAQIVNDIARPKSRAS